MKEVELVITGTGRMVHAYYRYAHRTACGIPSDRVFDYIPNIDPANVWCMYCERFAGEQMAAALASTDADSHADQGSG